MIRAVDRTAVPRVTVVFLLLAGTAITIFFLVRSAPSRLLFDEIAVPALAAVLVAFASISAGWLAVALARRLCGAEAGVIQLDEALLVGVAALGTLAGAVAWISVAPLPVIAVMLAFASIPLLATKRVVVQVPTMVHPAALLLVPPILLAALVSLAPATNPDELIYKLAVPHGYEVYGRMVELPLNSNSYLAMALQLADVPALMMGGGVAAKMLHFFVYVAALASIHRLAGRFTPHGRLAVVIAFAYTPALMISAGWAFSEWGTLGLLLVSFERYQRWLDSNDRGDFVLAFAAAGAAASVKYTALPWLLFFGGLVVWRHRREGGDLLRAAALTAGFGGFFYARNLIWTGSPVAPFLLPDPPEVENFRGGYAFSGWVEFFTGADVFDPRIIDEALGILLPLAIVAAVIGARWRDRGTRDLMLIGLLQMVVLLTIAPGSRNMINGIAALAVVGAAVLVNAVMAAGPLLRWSAALLAAVALFSQAMLSTVVLADTDGYLSGNESGAELLARTRTFAAPYSWAAQSLPADARLLLVGETRTFYLQREFVSGGNLDGPRVARWLSRFKSVEEMRAGLRSEGITHVLLHPGWIRERSAAAEPVDMLRRELLLELEPETFAMLRNFLARHATVRYRDERYFIFELVR